MTAKKPARNPLDIRWIVAALASVFGLYAGWKIVLTDLDNHWRLESIQAGKDKETDQKLKTLAKNAETGRAWVFWSIGDLKAQQQRQWAMACPSLGQRPDVCAQWKADAERYQADADQAKRDATKTGGSE